MSDFLENFKFKRLLLYEAPRGNQVGDLPRALHMGLGELASVGVWRLYVAYSRSMFYSKSNMGLGELAFVTRIAEVSSTRRVIWDWDYIHPTCAGAYLRFCMPK